LYGKLDVVHCQYSKMFSKHIKYQVKSSNDWKY